MTELSDGMHQGRQPQKHSKMNIFCKSVTFWRINGRVCTGKKFWSQAATPSAAEDFVRMNVDLKMGRSHVVFLL
jgi:hypothetical protein